VSAPKGKTLFNLTLEDIAKKAGVSRSTVSRVINNHPNVSEPVRKRVLDIIQNTGFQPNAVARSLASQRSWTIGLVLPHSVSFFFVDPYYPHLTKGIAQACNQFNYTLALFLVANKDDEDKLFPRISHKGFLDGVVVQSGHHGDQGIIGRMIDAGIPIVVAGRPFRFDNVSYIDVNNVEAAKTAVNHLIRLGRRRLGTITGPHNSTVGVDRLEGFKQAIQENGLVSEEGLITEGDFTEGGGYEAMKKLIPNRPDAIFAASDTMAMGAMRAAREENLRIPEDVAFVGFDDLPAAAYPNIRLTTIRQPTAQFGFKAVEILIEMIESGDREPRHIIMETEMIIRESCGASHK
jgi:LacI family transcriptional regulator